MIRSFGCGSPIVRAWSRSILPLKKRIVRVAYRPFRRDGADYTNSVAITDARGIVRPRRTKRSREFESITADPEVRGLDDLAGFNVGSGDHPTRAAVNRDDRLGVVPKVSDVPEGQCSG